MICTRCFPAARAILPTRPVLNLSSRPALLSRPNPSQSRTLTVLTARRPLFPSSPSTSTSISTSLSPSPTPFTPLFTSSSTFLGTAPSTHPSLATQQLRHAPRNTMQRWTHFVRKRRHGFLSRLRTKNGRKTLARRRTKGRSTLSH
ncbi:hypothetical protein P152DRAFT_511791 [Eremomyces bilateralis CBS 781.70]|uniref:Ribosomal protein L34 n=1 Tax=Eremomyces bilateralis CBS 781.70 TaxID=1392243 RepID=A0A6G1GC55_9PEZI|nr:uncharacterized protein P152DRAFT_511791 [Eremomyces bilateralis CBS 781.70]KAF1815675.1 hypothetical protein P152DRAFT_511791 [Eremomyces bilateralis CBS 781.70]